MLAEQVIVIDRGRIVQAGTGEELLHSPASRFVADFAGVNYVAGYAEGAVVHLPDGTLIHVGDAADGPVAVLVAPWEITLGLTPPTDTSALNHLEGLVERVSVQGNRARVRVGALTAEVTPGSVERLGIRPGLRVVASWKATSTRVVPRPDGARRSSCSCSIPSGSVTHGCMRDSYTDTVGWGKSRSANAPMATAIRPGRSADVKKTVEPQSGQKWKMRPSPWSDGRAYAVSRPSMRTRASGNRACMPNALPVRCWQA